MKTSMFTTVTPLLLCAGLGVSVCSPAFAVPAFARKYGLPCSACHEAWPKLNNFGLAFRDNGYQLINDRDAPIYQNPSYFPISFRATPQGTVNRRTEWRWTRFPEMPIVDNPRRKSLPRGSTI